MVDAMVDGEPHCCEELSNRENKYRGDLKEELIEGARTMYVDGCCFRSGTEGLRAGYVVVEQNGQGKWDTIKEGKVEPPSAQRAELRAMIQAIKRVEGQDVNIFYRLCLYIYDSSQRVGLMEQSGISDSSGKRAAT